MSFTAFLKSKSSVPVKIIFQTEMCRYKSGEFHSIRSEVGNVHRFLTDEPVNYRIRLNGKVGSCKAYSDLFR